jgi:hypothetical protein
VYPVAIIPCPELHTIFPLSITIKTYTETKHIPFVIVFSTNLKLTAKLITLYNTIDYTLSVPYIQPFVLPTTD